MAVSQQRLARFGRARRWARRLSSVVLFTLLVAVIYAFYLQLTLVLALRTQQGEFAKRAALLRAQNVALEQRLALQNDSTYLEYLARKELGLIKPGEVKILLPPEAP